MDALLGTCALGTLRQRRSFKWRTYPDDVLPAFVAEMDFDLAAPVIDAITRAVALGDCGYGHAGVLGAAFAAFAAARLGWAADPARVFAIPDVMTGLAEVIQALTPPGAGVVINPPVYPPFWFRFGFSGRRIVEAPLARDASGRYQLDPAALDRALGEPGVAAYLLCSLHNPTGSVWTREQLRTAADLCLRHDVVMLVDEIHAPLVLPGAEYVPFLSIDHEMTSRAFTFTSASKGWNIPGLKCGLAVAGSVAGGKLLAARWEAFLPGHLGVLASVAAFTDGLPWLDAVRAQLDENRGRLGQLLAGQLPGARYQPPEASFLAWIDCRGLGLDGDPAATFLDRGRVALSPGEDFGGQGRGFARLNMGTSPDLLAEAVGRMAAATA
ncbi:MAG: MalY/PatB family protein [Streptosporangiaceae bacterium]